MQKIGHRGAKSWVDENTLASIEKALLLEVNGIEVDVHKCKTGEIIVIHDNKVNRTTNGKGKVKKKTLEQLKLLKTVQGYSIPTLKEVLTICQGRCQLHIELKGKSTVKGTLACVEKAMENEKWKYEDIFISSFSLKKLQKIKEKNKLFPLGLIVVKKIGKSIKIAKKNKLKALYVLHEKIKKSHVKQCETLNIQLIAWTVNKSSDILKVKTLGVHGIISDYPECL